MGGETAWNMYSIDNNKEYCITLHLVGYTWKKLRPSDAWYSGEFLDERREWMSASEETPCSMSLEAQQDCQYGVINCRNRRENTRHIAKRGTTQLLIIPSRNASWWLSSRSVWCTVLEGTCSVGDETNMPTFLTQLWWWYLSYSNIIFLPCLAPVVR
jgi:hypothetical protein